MATDEAIDVPAVNHSVAPGCKFRDYRRRSRRAGSMNQNRDGSRQRRTPMKSMLTMLAAGACAGAFIALAGPAQAADMSLTRLDCGTPQAPVAVNQRFSDIYAYGDLKLQFVYSCYLIKHGDEIGRASCRERGAIRRRGS